MTAGWSVWASGAAAGFAGGAISTGSLKGAIRGAVLGGVTASVANHIGYGKSSFAKWAQKDIYNKAIAHGLSQGAISQVSGGNFKEGFLGGAFSSYTGDAWLDTSSGGVFIDTMISSVSGGIAAELGGGKFANGARSAAFVSLYNRFGRRFTNPREAYNRATGNVDILGRNRQQQQYEKNLRMKNHLRKSEFLISYNRLLHEMLGNLDDLRLYKPLTCDTDDYKWKQTWKKYP